MAHIVTANVVSPGMSMANCDAIMTLAAALTCSSGDVMSVDMTKVRPNTDGAFVFYEIRVPVTADYATASTAANVQPYMCVCLDNQPVAAGNVRVRFMGEVDATIEDSGLAIGAKLTGKNATRVLDTSATAAGSGTRALAVLKQATTAVSQIRRVDFDGLNGVIANGNQITN